MKRKLLSSYKKRVFRQGISVTGQEVLGRGLQARQLPAKFFLFGHTWSCHSINCLLFSNGQWRSQTWDRV